MDRKEDKSTKKRYASWYTTRIKRDKRRERCE